MSSKQLHLSNVLFGVWCSSFHCLEIMIQASLIQIWLHQPVLSREIWAVSLCDRYLHFEDVNAIDNREWHPTLMINDIGSIHERVHYWHHTVKLLQLSNVFPPRSLIEILYSFLLYVSLYVRGSSEKMFVIRLHDMKQTTLVCILHMRCNIIL